MTTENEFVVIAVVDLAANSLEKFVDFVDSKLRLDVTINNVDARAHDAALGVTARSTFVNLDNFALHAKLASRGAPSSANSPYPFQRLDRVSGMVIK